jgi:hypothetical protein
MATEVVSEVIWVSWAMDVVVELVVGSLQMGRTR